MGWYDVLSRFYDRSLEALYADARVAAADALAVRPGHRVLDLPCGTGLSFDALVPAVGPDGMVVGADLSPGMLQRAEARVEMRGWTGVLTIELDACATSRDALAQYFGEAGADRVLMFLGLTAMERYDDAFDAV